MSGAMGPAAHEAPSHHDTACAFVDELLTNGDGQTGERLAIIAGDGGGFDERGACDLGGWGREVLVARVRELLERPTRTPASARASAVPVPDRFFSFSPAEGFETHATADEARSRATDELGCYRSDIGDDGWDEEVAQICWGELRGEIVETERRPLRDGEPGFGDFEYFADYALVDIRAAAPANDAHEVARDAALAKIARQYLGLDTLVESRRDRLDFKTHGVTSIAMALRAAYDAGTRGAQRG